MKRINIIILFLYVVISGLYAGEPVQLSIHSGGYDRSYLLYVPNSNSKPSGLIVCLHGFNRNMYDFFSGYNIAQVADELNMVVLAPQALPEQEARVIRAAENLNTIIKERIPLDAAWGCGLRVKASILFIEVLNEELNRNVDDVGFIHSIIEKTQKDYGLDSQNVFLFGTSMGGFMSYQYAMYYGNSLSGLVSVCGSMGLSIRNAEAITNVPVCDFHSVDDEVVPYNGTTTQTGIKISLCQPKQDVISTWIGKNNASGFPQVESINNYPSENGKTVEKYTYSHPQNEVIHYKIHGASHSYYFKKENGDCMDYNEEVYKFIKKHTHISGNSIAGLSENRINIWPNPATSIINLSIDSGTLNIYDLNGKIVLSGIFQNGIVDISSLSKGFYAIRVLSGSQVFTGKLCVK